MAIKLIFCLAFHTKHIYMKNFSLLFYIGLCIETYLFHGWKRDLDLLREKEVVPSEKYVMYTSDILVNDFSLILLYLTEMPRFNPKTTDYSR